MASPNILVHLGPPKTGSTSLQHYFARLADKPSQPITYVGVRHPRATFLEIITGKAGSISERQYLLDSRQVSEEHLKYPEIGKVVDFSSPTGKPVVFSEEMYLIDRPKGIKWQEKLASLFPHFGGLEATPLIVLRDPKHGAWSLYQEVTSSSTQSVGWFFKLSPSAFYLFSNQARVFDYVYLLKILKKLGVNRIRILLLEDLSNGQLSSLLFGLEEHNDVRVEWKNGTGSQRRRARRMPFLLRNIPLAESRRTYRKLYSAVEAVPERLFSIPDLLSSLGTYGSSPSRRT